MTVNKLNNDCGSGPTFYNPDVFLRVTEQLSTCILRQLASQISESVCAVSSFRVPSVKRAHIDCNTFDIRNNES